MEAAIRLNDFAGPNAVIVGLNLPPADANRLKSMGVFVGQTVQVRRTGRALILSAAGARIAIDREIAAGIMVQANDQRAA